MSARVYLMKTVNGCKQGELGFRTLCCDVFGLLKTSFCVTTIIKIVNNNTNDKQTSGASLALDEDSPYTNSCLH